MSSKNALQEQPFKRGRGRPKGSYHVRTRAIEDEIIERLSTGEPLAQICRDEGMPHPTTVHDWADADKEFSQRLARARMDGFDQIAMDALEIADTPVLGWAEKYEKVTIPNPDDPEGEPIEEFRLTERRVADMIEHRKFQFEARLKLLKVWDRKRYGDSIKHEAEAGTQIVGLALLVAASGLQDNPGDVEAYRSIIEGHAERVK